MCTQLMKWYESMRNKKKLEVSCRHFMMDVSMRGIHEIAISVKFLGIIWRFLPSFLPFYKMQFMNKLKFSSLIDCLLRISETIRMVWLSVRFSSYPCIYNCCFNREKIYLYIDKV